MIKVDGFRWAREVTSFDHSVVEYPVTSFLVFLLLIHNGIDLKTLLINSIVQSSECDVEEGARTLEPVRLPEG